MSETAAANLLQARLSWPAAEGCARDLAWAGLLCTPAERVLIDLVATWRADGCPTWTDGDREHVLFASVIAAADRVLAERTPTDEPDATNEGDRG